MTFADALLPEQPLTRAQYESRSGYQTLRAAITEPRRARQILLDTSLTGLGGAHFPIARKIELVLTGGGPRVVLCNVAEDEPGSQKDRALLQSNPHLVIEGALLAATAIDASEVYFYVSSVLTVALSSLADAIAEIDTSITNGVALHIVEAPSRYVAGEASAAVRAINGGDAKPTDQPPYPTEQGVHGAPTLVSNCETLANLPRTISNPARHSGPASPSTRLATITGEITHPGVYEVEPTVHTVADLIELAGGVTGSGTLKAFQPGGPSSALLPADAASIPLSNDAIRAAGSQPGCFAIRIFSTSQCIVEVIEEIEDFFRREQCGQCPACRMKTQAYHRTIHLVATGHGSWDQLDKLSAVEEFISDMPRKCSLIDMPTRPMKSACSLFPEDFAAHIESHSCANSNDHPGSFSHLETAND